MNTPTICLGHLSSEEIIDLAGLVSKDFDGKRIVDVGCGFSDLLATLKYISSPEKLVGIDPIFGSSRSIELALENTKEHIERLIKDFGSLLETRAKLSRRLVSLVGFRSCNHGIEYYDSIESIGSNSFNYIFMSFVLSHLGVKKAIHLIDNYRSILGEEGEICIIDKIRFLRAISEAYGEPIFKQKGSIGCIVINN